MRSIWRVVLSLAMLLGLLSATATSHAATSFTAFCESNFSVFVITYNELPIGSLVEYQVVRNIDGSELTRGSFVNSLTDHFYSTSVKGGVGTYRVIVTALGLTQEFTTSCSQHWNVQGGQISAFCNADFNTFVITYSGVTVGLTFNYTVRSPAGAVIHSGSFTNSTASNFAGIGSGSPGANTVEISLSSGETATLTDVYCPGIVGGAASEAPTLPPGVESMIIAPANTTFEQESGLIDVYGNCVGNQCVALGSIDPVQLADLDRLDYIAIEQAGAGGWSLRVYYLGLDAVEGIARVYQINVYDELNLLIDDRTLIFAYPDGETRLLRR